MDDEPLCVFVANGQMQAQQVRAFLEANGVPCVLRGEALSKTHGLTLDGLGRVEVLASAGDESRAALLLASAESGILRLPDDVDFELS